MDIYKSDFEIERSSRQDLASEREELLADLKLLQRRNQQLIDEARSSRGAIGGGATSSSSTAPTSLTASQPNATTTGPYFCPICSRRYDKLEAVESHVNDCLLNAN